MKSSIGKWLLAGVLLAPFMSHAAVVNGAAVGGLRTFVDTNTGRQWLDIDNFFNATATVGTSGNDMIAAATAAGFTFARRADVEVLLNSLPLGTGQWSSYASVMGYGIPRQLIWGMYDDGNGNPFGYAFASVGSNAWRFVNDGTDAGGIQNGGSNGAVDMGIWAYRTGAPTPAPEPGTLALFGLGLGLAALSRKPKRRI